MAEDKWYYFDQTKYFRRLAKWRFTDCVQRLSPVFAPTNFSYPSKLFISFFIGLFLFLHLRQTTGHHDVPYCPICFWNPFMHTLWTILRKKPGFLISICSGWSYVHGQNCQAFQNCHRNYCHLECPQDRVENSGFDFRTIASELKLWEHISENSASLGEWRQYHQKSVSSRIFSSLIMLQLLNQVLCLSYAQAVLLVNIHASEGPSKNGLEKACSIFVRTGNNLFCPLNFLLWF